MGTYDGTYGFMLELDSTSSNKPYFRAGGTAVASTYAIAEDGLRKHIAYTKSGSV